MPIYDCEKCNLMYTNNIHFNSFYETKSNKIIFEINFVGGIEPLTPSTSLYTTLHLVTIYS